ncbi:MAG: class I SAM-dependent methyltransferase [Patescibacteria group bacterium]|nr:class I SAM-dependent methyltransferase [Patescibacteria group bacterium]
MKQQTELLERYNDKLAEVYDEASQKPEFDWRSAREVSSFVLPYAKPRGKVLDVGVGTGQSSEALYRAGCKITGVDISQKMLDAARKKFSDWDLRKADIEKDVLKFKKASFDIIVASGIFEFLDDLEGVLKKLAELLAPSGVICFTFEEYLPEHELQQFKVAELGRGIADPVPEQISFRVYRRTLGEIGLVLKKIGMDISGQKQFVSYFKTNRKIPIIYRVILARMGRERRISTLRRNPI